MGYSRGDHACHIYTSIDEMLDLAAPFLRDGLRGGERCWYVGNADEIAAVREALARVGVQVDAELARGALDLRTSEAVYLVANHFDVERMLSAYNDEVARASADGFTSFRVAADMTWALGDVSRAERVIEYEALVGTLFRTTGSIGLCFYDLRRMPPSVIDGALIAHAVASVGEGTAGPNPYYRSGQTASADPAGLEQRLAALREGKTESPRRSTGVGAEVSADRKGPRRSS